MSKLDDRETLDHAVSRIAKESLEAELSREAAIRQGTAWAYRDAAEILRRDCHRWPEACALGEYDDPCDKCIAASALERKAEEIERG